MDNVRFHKSNRVQTMLPENGDRIIYLPAFSPFLNPIENFCGSQFISVFPQVHLVFLQFTLGFPEFNLVGENFKNRIKSNDENNEAISHRFSCGGSKHRNLLMLPPLATPPSPPLWIRARLS
ncbi:hypothetical protein RF11_15874 [Thelohanellus kitauei]|uniref:Tc1-like transposase DDE domain-containing protein n=1 Tax=Thelohanellus kitauei TaxID=669202 RepID=A0A0C2JLP5_THEKT|nr:hypothetical protein RF11_15874 [Thelohanellus kitauei]